LIGEPKVLSLLLKIKDSAVLAGHSPPLDASKVSGKSRETPSLPSPNNSSWTVISTKERTVLAMEVYPSGLSNTT
jgi:hypothetical protein